MRFRFDSYTLDCDERVLRREGELVPLTPKMFDVLRLLAQRSGSVVSKQEFMETLWPNSFVEEANLTQTVFLLRKALGSSPAGRPYIETVPKRGYCFAGLVTADDKSAPEFSGDAEQLPENKENADILHRLDSVSTPTVGRRQRPLLLPSRSYRCGCALRAPTPACGHAHRRIQAVNQRCRREGNAGMPFHSRDGRPLCLFQ